MEDSPDLETWRRRKMINGGVSELACRDRLRSHDINGKNKKEDKRKLNNYEEEEDDDEEEEEEEDDDDEEEDEEERKMLDGAKKKKWKASAAVLEKRTKLPINLEKDDVEVLDGKAKNKGDKRIHGGDDKTTYRKNKKSSSHGSEHKVQIGDHDKDKRRSTLPPLDKNKDSLKEKSRKMSCTHSAEKKLHSCDHHKDKRKSMHSNSKYCERHKKKNKHLSSHNGENKKRVYDYVQHKGRSKPHLFNNNEMQKNEMKKKKKNTPLDLSKENKTQMMIDSKKENKRKKTAEIFDKSKKMRTEDKGENAWSGDRWKMKNTTQGYNKEQKVQSGHKEQRNVIFAFIKIVYNNNFKEFLLIPPAVEPKLKDFTNRRVSLQDSEGNFSSVRLSVVDGYLAFREGWDSFVSDHSIKLGDVLLFEYTARLHFSVRVFGMDSCERVCFSVEMQGRKKQKGCHPPDETDAAKSMNAVSGARPVAVNSKEDPHRVVSWVEHGSSIALSDKDGYLDNGKHTSNAIIQTWTKGTKSSEIILIADDEAPLTQENEDTEKLKTLHAASEMHYVTANTEEDPKGGASGALCGPSVALDNMEGNLAVGECKTNCISSVCSTEETIRSEIIPVTDASPLAQEKDDVVEVTIFPPHIEDTGMTKGSEPEIDTPTKCTEIQDSDKDLRRKQEGNTVQLECTTALEKSPNNSKMDANGNVCSKYEAPGGSASLEKWKKATVSGRAALDGTLPVKPEKLLKTEEKLVHNFSSVGGNSFEQSLQGGSPSLDKWNKVTVSGRAALDGTVFIKPEKLPKTEERLVHNVSSVGVNSFEQSLEKWKKTIGSGQAALDGTGLIKPEKLVKTEDKLVSNCSSMGVNYVGQSLQGYAGRAALDVTGLIRPEKQLKTDDKLVGNCSATGVNLVEQSSRRYAGTHSCVQQTPGKISKSTHIKTEIDLLVNGKGPTIQPKTQMDQFEPMGSISCRQQLNNGPVRANHAVARPSEHHSFDQEDRKDSHHVTQAVLLPVKIEVLELDNHSVLKTNLQFCIPSTTQTWLLLPTSLPNALRRKGRLDRNVVMLKDPMKRLWPVFYHENPVFVGFTRGWKPFVAANELRTGDICVLLKDLDEDELVYHVQITRK